MKAEETRKNLIKELNMQFAKASNCFSKVEDPGDPVITFPSPSFEKPKMFEPLKINNENKNNFSESSDIFSIKGIGFKDATIITGDISKEKKIYSDEPIEIYDMKKLIQSSPEGMRTLSIEPKVVKSQFALVKRKEWQDILFGDVDWFKEIDLTAGFKKIFRNYVD